MLATFLFIPRALWRPWDLVFMLVLTSMHKLDAFQRFYEYDFNVLRATY